MDTQAGSWSLAAASLAVFLGSLPAVHAAVHASAARGVVTGYIDPTQQTALPFPERSHWLQPWRAYQDTPPTSRVRDAIGINLNVSPDEADSVCRHLSKNGFRFARIEFGWGSVSWDHPTQLADPAPFDKIVGACRRYHLRPLFLLNAHHGAPVPMRTFQVRLLVPAHKGDRTVSLDPATIGPIVPGRSGLSRLTDYWAAEDLFTAVDAAGTASLSKPLPK
ncbi:MAG: hypothetical protein LC772_10735, partial [Chloroflexi bacterium]|nr:hypothetical protein [Chloroflexota bacterium]